VRQREMNVNSIDNELDDENNSKVYSYESSIESAGDYNQIELASETQTVEVMKRTNIFNPVDLNDHTFDKYKYNIPYENPKSYSLKVKLPNEISCKRCVLRWIYITGNTWGLCNSSNEGRSGCGKQEEFRNCADIKIH